MMRVQDCELSKSGPHRN